MKTFYRSLLLATSGTLSSTLALLSTPIYAENLSQLYEDAVKNDHSFLAAKAQLKSGLENKKLGRAGLLPQINASAQWEKSDGDGNSVQFRDIDNDETTPDEAVLTPYDIDSSTTTYRVSLDQALFDLNAWHTYKRGNALANEAEAIFAEA